MRKNYFKLNACIALLCFGSLQVSGQLSGVYTINSALSTGGSNYQTINDFATDINANGVNGAVTVNIVANTGPYNEQVLFDEISGASTVNKITINGNNNLMTFSSSNTNQRYVMGFNGSDYFTVNDLNLSGTGTYAYVCLLYNGANNNTFSNCTFSVPVSATSSNIIPIVLSGSGTSYATSSNSGNNNVWMNCSTIGGWAGVSFYGASSAPRNEGNKIYNCNIGDFYQYGIRTYYHWGLHIRGNTLERLTRPSTSTTYGLYSYYAQGSIYENNKIHKLFDAMPNTSATTYAMYFYNYFSPAPTQGGSKNNCRNNIVSDLQNSGTTYGMYAYYFDGNIHHNTISLDYTAATTGITYGIYAGAQAGQETDIRNNIVSISRGGTSTKYGMYVVSPAQITVDYNNVYMNASGTVYHGNYNSLSTNLTSFQADGADVNGYDLDPIYTSLTLNDLRPTNASLNNKADPTGLVFDHADKVRNQTTPDIGALEFLTPVCSGTPPSNTVTAPTYSICSGESVELGLASLFSDDGYTYQWRTSTFSQVGPFTVIPGANNLFYTASNVTQNSWYSIVITCTASANASVSAVGQIMVAGPTVGSIPYYEGFEGIGKQNRLPNCSWAATSPGEQNETHITSTSNNRVPRSGTSFASFSNSNPGTSLFYTHPIQMNSGITYSAALWFTTDYLGNNNWSELSILVGPNQSTTGLVQVATISPALSGPYKLLDNIFTVPASGQYYVAIRASSTSGNAYYLSWDDLSITIPCGPGSPNSPTISASASQNTVCAGTPISIIAVGADTYSWSNGSSGASLSDSPMISTNYIVYGTNALTGCTSTVTNLIQVNPKPEISIGFSNNDICPGDKVVLSAHGAISYMWTTSESGANIIVSPMSTTSYTVTGLNSFGCSSSAITQISVHPSPTVVVNSSQIQACRQDQILLSAYGAANYIWFNNIDALLYQGPNIYVSPQADVTFTVQGTDVNGCKGNSTIDLYISECTDINSYNLDNVMFKLFPNPGTGLFFLQSEQNTVKDFQVIDISGRVLMTGSDSEIMTSFDLREYAAGVYYLSVKSGQSSQVIKVIKQ